MVCAAEWLSLAIAALKQLQQHRTIEAADEISFCDTGASQWCDGVNQIAWHVGWWLVGGTFQAHGG